MPPNVAYMSTPPPTTDENDAPKRSPEKLATAETHYAADESEAAAEAGEGLFGRVIDERYRIVRVLGEGGMGSVYAAEHLKLGSEVALKVIRPELMKKSDIAARFAREAMASARLNHPHVASALDYGTLPGGGAYLVMQLARGRSLTSLLEERGALPWPLAVEIAAQVADAADAAHALGIVHRDLKPDNVFVEERDGGSVLCQVLDFGIARVQVEGESTNDAAAPGKALTTVGTIMGTPGYMAPEQAMGQAADARADLYALGVMLAEMVSGEPLFAGETLTSIVTAQLTQGPPRVTEKAVALGLPPDLEGLLRSLVAPEAETRPTRASEVRDELRRIARAHDAGASGFHRTGEVSVIMRPPAQPASAVTGFGVGSAATQGADARPLLDQIRESLPSPLARLPKPVLVGSAALVLVAVIAVLLPSSESGAETPATEAPAAETTAPSSLIPAPIRPIVEAAKSVRANVELERAYSELVSSEDPAARKAAAERLAAHQPAEDVSAVARAASELELARTCGDRRIALQTLGEIGDASVLPALERLAAAPRRGCGFLSTKDCHRCLRDDLASVIERLGGSATR